MFYRISVQLIFLIRGPVEASFPIVFAGFPFPFSPPPSPSRPPGPAPERVCLLPVDIG